MESVKVLVETDLGDLDKSALLSLKTLPVMLLEDLLNGLDGVRLALTHQPSSLRLHLHHTVRPLLPLLRHPLACSQHHLLLLELLIDLIKFVDLLLTLHTLHVQTALEVLTLLPRLLHLLLLLSLGRRPLRLVKSQLGQDELCLLVSGHFSDLFGHIKGTAHFKQTIWDPLLVLVGW